MKRRRGFTLIELLVVPETRVSSKRRSGRAQVRAFTLIELLVVIAIIAILNAMLAPAFSTAIDRANLETCQAHLREISLATKMYFEEHGDYPPSLQSLYDAHLLDDENILRCTKTGKRFHYQRKQPGADRAQVFVSCVPPSTKLGKRPHFFGDAFASARVSGKVEVQRQ